MAKPEISERSPRAGSYQKQLTGYSAFIPKSLPPEPPVQMDLEMQTLLSKADRALGRLDGSIQTLPNPDLFVFMYVRKEAVLSSQIEGTQSSLADILEVEASVFDPHHPSDVGEVLNYVTAMNYGLERLKELPISIRLIREIHNELLHDVRGREKNPGELRTTQNWIGPGGCTLRDATFIPPPPHEVINALGMLETFIHSDIQLPTLIKIGLIHAQFETIHPFLDGNGRIGRLLITFLLCQSEVLIRPVLYISHFFRRHRSEYYERLQRVRDFGDWEGWIKFFLNGIATVSLEATETARSIVALRERDREIVQRTFGRAAGNGLTILESLFESPIVTIGQVQQRLGVTYPPANGLVQRLVEAGVLDEITGQERYRVYQYRPYIELFSERRGEAPMDDGPSQSG
jgi:Fic family protein